MKRKKIYNNIKIGPKVEGEWLDLTFKADGEGFKMGNGNIYYGKDKEDYAFLAFTMPRAIVINFLIFFFLLFNIDLVFSLLLGIRKSYH